MFVPIGCSGLTYSEISAEAADRLNKAPFLSFKITAQTFDAFMKELLNNLKGITPASESKTSVHSFKGVDPKPLYGPVYMLCGLNMDTNNIEAMVYLPSMQKNGKPWESYPMLCYFHRWMYILLYSSGFSVKPVGACVKRLPDTGSALVMGCYSTTGKCVQKIDTLKQMGIYDKKKNQEYTSDSPATYGYPIAFMRSYMLNPADTRIEALFNGNGFPDLQLNALVPDFEVLAGCNFILVSRSYTYFMMLESKQISIYKNKIGSKIVARCSEGGDLRREGDLVRSMKFPGGWQTRMIIEETTLNVFSKSNKTGSESIVMSLQLVQNTSEVAQPIALVLEDDGKLVVYDKDSKNITGGELGEMKPLLPSAPSPTLAMYDPRADREQRLKDLAQWTEANYHR
jgi:hypothetical protein